MKSTHKRLPVAISAIAVLLMFLALGWTTVTDMVQGRYGHTITDGPTGFTLSPSASFRADTLGANKRIVGDSTYVTLAPGNKGSGGWPLHWGPVPMQVFWDNTRAVIEEGRTCNNIVLRGAYPKVTDGGFREDNIVIQGGKVWIECLGWYNQGMDISGEVEILVGPPKTSVAKFSRGGVDVTNLTSNGGAYLYGTTQVDILNISYGGLPIGRTVEATGQLTQYQYDETWENIIDSTYYGPNVKADTALLHTIALAKDTTLEIALFTRTCTRDTLAYMTGADSLTAAYIVTPFATRGSIIGLPCVAGVVDGKLVVDRPAADTASYDRYSVIRILQR